MNDVETCRIGLYRSTVYPFRQAGTVLVLVNAGDIFLNPRF
jgi:hypothetical protein